MNSHNTAEMVILWLLVIVRTGVLVAIVWYGIIEFRKWRRKNNQ